MRYTHHDLTKLVVQTESGTVLGKVADTVYDMDSYTIVQFVVTGGMLKSHQYWIHPNQIVSITSGHMIVQDTVERITEDKALPSQAAGASPAMMRETE